MDERLRRYGDTILEIKTVPGMRVDLRKPLGAGARESLRALGLGATFGVVTADNPRGQDAPGDENERREAALARRARKRGWQWVGATGCSPDGQHCEDGIAVALDRSQVQALGREFEQDAVFWFDGQDIWIDGARLAVESVRLPVDGG